MDKRSATTLNPAQQAAVNHRDGPLLVIAGAGAGKTRTIACRILNLIEGGVQPTKILALTFTNKAAKEMLGRVLEFAGNTRPFISTFHALGATLVRENAGRLGLNQHFSIADRDDSLSLIKTAIKDSGFDSKSLDPRRFLNAISREKSQLVTFEQFAAENRDGEPWPRLVTQIWEHYETTLRRRKTLDFDDLLLRPVKFLQAEPFALAAYRARWHYLLIDEYQDTNLIQYHLARLLAGPTRNICAVGDLDQAIYSWRGADCRHLLRFAEDYPGAKIITLEENYRSSQTILAAANQIISKNVNRVEKNLYTSRGVGERLSLIVGQDEREEAELITAAIGQCLTSGVPAAEIAVLYRANFQSRIIEESLLRAGLPYRVLGVRFFERREVKDVLAYLKAAVNPDDLESWRRIVNVPARGLGKVAVTKFLAGQTNSLPARQRQKLATLQQLLERIARRAKQGPVAQTLSYIITESGLANSLKNGAADDRERLENIQELVSLAVKYDEQSPDDGINNLLNESALVSDQDTLDLKPAPAVSLMTVHAAKGLEFEQVFVTGLEQELFPHLKFASEENDEIDHEEERRLFYVALTRAKEKLHLSYAQTRTIFGRTKFNQPSEFLLDLDVDLFENLNDAS
ncbi:MAG: UvrD-helicase domain-containing protein [Patescibacteria group bacterium]